MITKGWIVNEAIATAVVDNIEYAQTSRGLPVYWTTGKMEIFSGPFAGLWFIPFEDSDATVNLRDGMTPLDFPEASDLLALLGGLDARVEIDALELINPNTQPSDV